MRKRKIAVLLCFCLLLSGCWSRVEVNDLAVVLGLAIDKGETERVRVTLYIARSIGNGGGEQQAGGAPTWVVSREAGNENDAIAKVALASSRRISLHHIRAVLIGEEFAHETILGMEDFITRNPQVRLTARLFVVKGKAQTVLETLPNLKALQPNNLVDILDAANVPKLSLKDYLVARTSLNHSGWMHAVRVAERQAGTPGSPETATTLDGVGLFKGNALVGWMDQDATRGLFWMLNKAKDQIISADCPDGTGHTFSARVMEGRSGIAPSLVNGRLTFRVMLRGELELLRVACTQTDMRNPDTRELLRSLLNRKVQSLVRKAVDRSQETQTDPAGFGKRVELKYTGYWEQIKRRWPELWAGLKVTIDADLSVQNAGLLAGSATETEIEAARSAR